jgi:GNAT superfamily N-acetyltransferase
MAAIISRERPDTVDAAALIAELDAELALVYATENRHGFSVERLLAEDVAFFVARENGVPVACGGVKVHPEAYAEIKRMFVRPAWRGRGLSRFVLEHLVSHARARGIAVVRLETGIHQSTAIRLYESSGFAPTTAFGEYVGDGISLFYEKRFGSES